MVDSSRIMPYGHICGRAGQIWPPPASSGRRVLDLAISRLDLARGRPAANRPSWRWPILVSPPDKATQPDLTTGSHVWPRRGELVGQGRGIEEREGLPGRWQCQPSSTAELSAVRAVAKVRKAATEGMREKLTQDGEWVTGAGGGGGRATGFWYGAEAVMEVSRLGEERRRRRGESFLFFL